MLGRFCEQRGQARAVKVEGELKSRLQTYVNCGTTEGISLLPLKKNALTTLDLSSYCPPSLFFFIAKILKNVSLLVPFL